VVVAPRRADAVRLLEQSGEVDIIITDDGLQHYALARDIELVVVDGARRFGNACLLPMGPLREPVTRLKRVDAIICNGGEPGRGEYPMRLVADLRRVCDEAPLATPLAGPVDALAGIGHPPRFFATLEGLGYQLDQRVAYGDHHPFDRDELVGRFAGKPLLMTEKDAVKCRAFALGNWWYLPVSAELPASLLDTLLHKLGASRKGKAQPRHKVNLSPAWGAGAYHAPHEISGCSTSIAGVMNRWRDIVEGVSFWLWTSSCSTSLPARSARASCTTTRPCMSWSAASTSWPIRWRRIPVLLENRARPLSSDELSS
jgi:hypothetical protein